MQLTPFGTSPRSALALVPAAVARSLASAPSHPSLTAELPPLEGAAAVEALAGSSSPSRVLNPAVVGANDSGWFIPRIAAPFNSKQGEVWYRQPRHYTRGLIH